MKIKKFQANEITNKSKIYSFGGYKEVKTKTTRAKSDGWRDNTIDEKMYNMDGSLSGYGDLHYYY
jgi:hypothetical protein